jgi:hypothetical protein
MIGISIANSCGLNRHPSPAEAFLTATGITDTTIVDAINTLVYDLQIYQLWGKMKALYPFVGGTAETHKFNLINPLDTNAAFRLAFNGGWTHDLSGVTPNGTTGYANTFLRPYQVLNQNSTHLSIFSSTEIEESGIDMGCREGGGVLGRFHATLLQFNNDGEDANFSLNGRQSLDTRTAVPSENFLIGSRINATQEKYYISKDGLFETIDDYLSRNPTPNVPISIGALTSSTNEELIIEEFCSKTYGFASIGYGLNETDAEYLLQIVDTFLKTLGRV